MKKTKVRAAIVARTVVISLPEVGCAAGVDVVGGRVATPTMLGGTSAGGVAGLIVAGPEPETAWAVAMATAAGGDAVEVDKEAAAGGVSGGPPVPLRTGCAAAAAGAVEEAAELEPGVL
jgi:hypothetical protein